MNKIWIILKSEFLRRVLTKWFILSTLLAPIFLVGIAVVPGILAVVASEGERRTIAVEDETNVLFPGLLAAAESQFELVRVEEGSPENVRAAVENGQYDGYLLLPDGLQNGTGEAVYYSAEGSGISMRGRIEHLVNSVVENYRLSMYNVQPEVLQILESNVPIRMVVFTEEGEAADSTVASSIIGYIMGLFIYITIFIYGAFVMQGVIEEKTSRVVEVMISSIRPFELMMGKVLGIGAMGLVQMALWGLLILAGIAFAGEIISLFIDPSSLNLPAGASTDEIMASANISLPHVSPMIFVWFILYFLGGYLLYASLFAAIGSAVEQQQDAQALTLPITLLILIPIIFMSFLIESPNSTLSVVLSLIPFFSPILMIVRLAIADVPLWQSTLAYLLLVGTFIGTIWMSGRIYRVGILMYGKKPAIKDLIRWFRYA